MMQINGLTDEERGRLLTAARKIYSHKLVQIKVYRTLVKRARDERIRQLLIRISDDEEKHAARARSIHKPKEFIKPFGEKRVFIRQ